MKFEDEDEVATEVIGNVSEELLVSDPDDITDDTVDSDDDTTDDDNDDDDDDN